MFQASSVVTVQPVMASMNVNTSGVVGSQPVGSQPIQIAGNQPFQPGMAQVIQPAVGTQVVRPGTPVQLVQSGNQPNAAGPQKIIIIQVGFYICLIKPKNDSVRVLTDC